LSRSAGERDLPGNRSYRLPNDLFAKAVLVAGRRVDEIQARIDRTLCRRDALLDRQPPIGKIADAQGGCDKSGAAQGTAGRECWLDSCGHGITLDPAFRWLRQAD
jgi:hypothetical protein